MTTYIIVVLCCAVLVLLRTLGRARALNTLLPSAFGGVAGLITVHLSSFFGMSLISLNVFTLSIAVFLGIPGVVGLLLMRLVCII